MSFAFAGALQGLGGGLMKVAEDRRKLADDLLKMEKKAELDKDVAESRAASKARHRKGGTGSGGSSGGRSGRALSNTESDNLARLYKDYAENGAFEGEAPGLGAFETRVEQLIKEEGSLAKAAERARGEWGSTEVTSTELKERHPLSPARLWDDDGKYEETTSSLKYGFRGAMEGGSSGNAAPAAPAASAPSAAAPSGIPSAAIEALKANPNLREQFDAKYGQGAAASILGS
ncbi:hypothetical protein PXK30_09510 [Phaeobacter gallaeciensis]|uniref:hypothetical protein n=1 Tax=Phaeobacter gallaeciensis TaxID=60890 RepID=UPI00237FB14C|nr:hypothetical protein [Phaeobacter gallaeciensis]MDE4303641.1 hypothetical protein [Phaeobacter gallaeciensis]MDE4307877.1 hypothetical protein [Phaeobacter gallaeciensis]MDE4312335.1 hypothetical protein [Phaeobacter gallaeciensis]MDE4316806.1 hypothetical protein [Phaeobacter gallaeciensis]MDE4321269.1 hypothetical protein [Phaeobacter gallaeciensis]